MDRRENRGRALRPEDLARFFVSRANAGDVERLVALYEPDATLAGTEEIRNFYATLLADRPRFEPGEQSPALRSGELALTSSRLRDGTVTAKVARRRPDGTWLWVVDQPSIDPSPAGREFRSLGKPLCLWRVRLYPP